MGRRNAKVKPEQFALEIVGSLIIIGSVVCGIATCVLMLKITMSRGAAGEVYGAWIAAIVLGVLLNIGFGFFLRAIGEIRDEIKKISTGLERTRAQEKQAGDGTGSS